MSLFYKPSKYNGETRQQMWMSVVQDFHDSFCNCTCAFAHLLDCIFPEGHKDKDLTIRQIIDRDTACRFGGEEDESHGMAAGTSAATLIKQEEGDQDTKGDEGIEELIAAVEDAERR